MRTIVIILILVGLGIGNPLKKLIYNSNAKPRLKNILWFIYMGLYISFVAVFMSYAIDPNYVSTAKWSSPIQLLVLTPIVSVLFYSLDSLTTKNK